MPFFPPGEVAATYLVLPGQVDALLQAPLRLVTFGTNTAALNLVADWRPVIGDGSITTILSATATVLALPSGLCQAPVDVTSSVLAGAPLLDVTGTQVCCTLFETAPPSALTAYEIMLTVALSNQQTRATRLSSLRCLE